MVRPKPTPADVPVTDDHRLVAPSDTQDAAPKPTPKKPAKSKAKKPAKPLTPEQKLKQATKLKREATAELKAINKRPRGGPSKFTPQLEKTAIKETEGGATRAQVAAACGISKGGYFLYLANRPDFQRKIKAAEEVWRKKKLNIGSRRRVRDDPAGRCAHLGRVLAASPDSDPTEVAALVARAGADEAAAAELEQRALQACRDHLLPFAVHTYQGNRPWYRVSWHHRLLAELLERFAKGQLRRLLISLPPRHGKTELAIKALGAWILGRDPDARIIAGAYSARLASKSSKATRRVVASVAFQEVFPSVRLPDHREVLAGEYTMQGGEWDLAGGARGGYYASGLSGSVTGMGGGYVLVDDPCKNRQEAESILYQETVLERYQDDWASRTEQPDCRLVMATRWGDRDLIGQLIELAASDETADKWVVVNIPAILDSEDDRCLGDPREIGDPIWPELYLQADEWENPPDLEVLKTRAIKDLSQKIKVTVGGEALYQGRATKREGGILKEEWCQTRWKVLPDVPGEWLQSWDPKASSSKRNWASYTVGQVWFRPTGTAQCYLVDERRARVGIDGAIVLLHELTEAWPQALRKIVERTGYGSTMLDLCRAPHAIGSQQFTAVAGLDDNVPRGSKVSRLESVVPLWSAGNVVLPDVTIAPWVVDWVREVTRFSGKATDVADRVDAMSQALDRWRTVRQPFLATGGSPRASSGFNGSAPRRRR